MYLGNSRRKPGGSRAEAGRSFLVSHFRAYKVERNPIAESNPRIVRRKKNFAKAIREIKMNSQDNQARK